MTLTQLTFSGPLKLLRADAIWGYGMFMSSASKAGSPCGVWSMFKIKCEIWQWNNSPFSVISLVGQWQPSLSVAACVNNHSVVCYLLKKCPPRLFNWQSLYPDLPYNSLNPFIIPFQKFSLTSLFDSPMIPHSAVGNWQCTWCHRVVTCMHQLNFFYCIWWKVGSL